MSNNLVYSDLMMPESPQPLHKPGQLTRFPYPNPHINTNSAPSNSSSFHLYLNENWN